VERAKLAAAQYRNALHLFPTPASGWQPKVLTYSGYFKLGIAEIWSMIDEYVAFTEKNQYFVNKRNSQAKYWMYETINEQLKSHFYNSSEIEKQLKINELKVLNSEISSFAAAREMLDDYFRNFNPK
ncbi:MAG: methylmalonyl Co-A mutase-associated GTPase MeaB, partial [Dysgonamonadaceae bacterium]|nr:methylmalonyl Co-A mutase-associated GTPase MeaB [Dysgonamonadaceae bacterium]